MFRSLRDIYLKEIKMRIPEKKVKWLVFPVENFVREFHGKLLLSAVAAERGWGTLIGYKGLIRHNLPENNGVVLEMNMTQSERVNRFLDLGWRVCAWDEEGLIYINGDDYALRRLDPGALDKLDLIFLWGENQRKDILSHVKGVESKLILTGNPRFDLHRPDLREFYAPAAAALLKKHGRYILINTAFGSVNHYFGKEYIFGVLREAGKMTTEEQELDEIAREKHQELVMRAFIAMLPELSSHFPEHKIIIRPHPAENFETWVSAARGLPNVAMIHEGDPIPWMLGADVMIHNSCTTGVQAYLLGRPVISYMPVESDIYDKYLPNALSHKVQGIDQLIRVVGELVSNPAAVDQKMEQEKRLITMKYIESLEGRWASDRIMDELEKLDINPQVIENHYFSSIKKKFGQPVKFFGKLKEWLRYLRTRKNSNPALAQGKNWGAYQRHRFPTLSFKHVQSDLKRLQAITGRFSNVRVCRVGDDLICIYPSDNK